MNQCEEILNYLEHGNALTPLDSLRLFGCFRLGARIFELRQQGFEIEDEWVRLENGKKIKKYYMREAVVIPSENQKLLVL